MLLNIEDSCIRIVVLDISGLYVQIHDQGYYPKEIMDEIKSQYSDTLHWRVVVLD